MANEYMKEGSAALIYRKRQIKILVREYFISNKGTKIKKSIKKLNMLIHYDPMISLPEKLSYTCLQ